MSSYRTPTAEIKSDALPLAAGSLAPKGRHKIAQGVSPCPYTHLPGTRFGANDSTKSRLTSPEGATSNSPGREPWDGRNPILQPCKGGIDFKRNLETDVALSGLDNLVCVSQGSRPGLFCFATFGVRCTAFFVLALAFDRQAILVKG